MTLARKMKDYNCIVTSLGPIMASLFFFKMAVPSSLLFATFFRLSKVNRKLMIFIHMLMAGFKPGPCGRVGISHFVLCKKTSAHTTPLFYSIIYS